MVIKNVSIFLHNENNEYLLFKRSLDNKYCPGQYHLLSGKVEKNEDLENALRREVLEETGIQDFEITKTYPMFETNWKDDKYFIYLFEGMIPENANIVINDEHDCYKWVAEDKLKEMDLTPGLIEDLEYIGVF